MLRQIIFFLTIRKLQPSNIFEIWEHSQQNFALSLLLYKMKHPTKLKTLVVEYDDKNNRNDDDQGKEQIYLLLPQLILKNTKIKTWNKQNNTKLILLLSYEIWQTGHPANSKWSSPPKDICNTSQTEQCIATWRKELV